MWGQGQKRYPATWKHTKVCDYCAANGLPALPVEGGCNHFRGGKSRKENKHRRDEDAFMQSTL